MTAAEITYAYISLHVMDIIPVQETVCSQLLSNAVSLRGAVVSGRHQCPNQLFDACISMQEAQRR